MRLSLTQLEALLWIDRLGGFRAAAAKLNLSQPAISTRMRELERAVGGPLFVRRGPRTQLNALGREVLGYAEPLVAMAKELERRVASPRALNGPIRMGVADSFALTHLSDLLVQIERDYPGAWVELDVDYSANLNARLHRGEIDLAVLTAPVPAPAIHTEPLVDLRLRWVASPRLSLPEGVLRPRDLKDLPIVTNPRPSHLFASIQDWFATAGVMPSRLNTCNSLAVLERLVGAGFGVGLLPMQMLPSDRIGAPLRILHTEPEIQSHPMAIAYRRDGDQDLSLIRDMILPLVQRDDARPG